MNINVNSPILKYDQTKIDVESIKEKIKESKSATTQKTDKLYISDEGRKILEEKMTSFQNENIPHIEGRLTNISTQHYVDVFGQKMIASGKSEDMDAHFKEMKNVYDEMTKDIEEKYNEPMNDEVYFLSQHGGIELLTKEKELEMLNFAYESHKSLVENSRKIWERGL